MAVAGAALVPIAVGAASGGYFPSAWGWISLVALWVAALALLLGTPQLGRRDTAFLALLAPRLRAREPLAIALAAGVIALVCLPFVPAGIPLLIVAVLVAALGFWTRPK